MIRRATRADLPAITRLHIAAFPGFLLTQLGSRFLTHYYDTALACPSAINLVDVDDDGAVVGFVVGYVVPAEFYARLRRRRPALAVAAGLHLAVRPQLWRRVLANIKRLDASSEHAEGEAFAELASIGVDPGAGGRGSGRRLVAAFTDAAFARGAEHVTLTTDAEGNDRVNAFYRDLGFRLERRFDIVDRSMNEYVLDAPAGATQHGEARERRRLLFVTHWYDPEPVIRPSSLGRGLVQRSHDVEVITGFPNYPTGRIYDGFRLRPRMIEARQGITVQRLAMFPDRSDSALRRLVSHASLALSSAVVLPSAVRRSDVVWIHSPSPPSAIVTALCAKAFNKPFVYEIQDMWPEAVAASGMATSSVLLTTIEQINRRIYRHVDRFVVITETLRERLVAKGVAAERITVIPNWAEEGVYQPQDAEPSIVQELNPDGRFLIVYGGNHGKAQALANVLDTAELLGNDVRFAMIGTGVEAEALAADARRRGLDNVVFLGQRPLQDMPRYYAAADALLVHLSKDDEFSTVIPSKLTAYLSCGRPIVGAVGGEAARVISESKAGVWAPAQDPRGLADAINRLRANSSEERTVMAANAREYYLAHFDRDNLVDAYEELFLGLRP